jgi:hypothetical protein
MFTRDVAGKVSETLNDSKITGQESLCAEKHLKRLIIRKTPVPMPRHTLKCATHQFTHPFTCRIGAFFCQKQLRPILWPHPAHLIEIIDVDPCTDKNDPTGLSERNTAIYVRTSRRLGYIE